MAHETPSSGRVGYLAAQGLLGDDWVEHPYVEVGADGLVTRTCAGRPADAPAVVHDLGRCLLLPGMVNAHSHAFQRAVRGATQRRGASDPSSFWSWREAMYRFAGAIDFYRRAFGAREVARIAAPGGQGIGHAELRLGDTVLFLSEEVPG